MLSLNPARKRPEDRRLTESDKTPTGQVKTYPAPTLGLVTNAEMAQAPGNSAIVLENFLATETGVRPRGGYVVKATVAGTVGSMFSYRSGAVETFFAADATGIYTFNAGTPAGTALTASVTGQTGSDYSALETETAGGVFLTVVNGEDAARQYNGTAWSVPSITGVSTALLSHVWAYRSRQFFVEKGTMNAWYLGINSVSGAATKLPLSGVFNKGGSLLFGDTWSADAGDGLDDRCAFVTTEGEVALYTGTDPASASTWALEGVFDIGTPLGRSTYFKVGGDLVVATEAGLIPLSAATQKDTAALSLTALSRPIDPTWREAIALGTNDWKVSKWQRGGFAFVAPPNLEGEIPRQFVVNLRNGAWSTVTGWDATALASLGDYPFFASGSRICQAETGGQDNGASFACRACYAHDHMGAPAAYKTAQAARATFKARTPYTAKVSIAADYSDRFPTPPAAAMIDNGSTSLWDVAAWDVAPWGSSASDYTVSGRWVTVAGQGYTLAPQVQLLSSDVSRLDCELLSIDVLYSVGQAVV